MVLEEKDHADSPSVLDIIRKARQHLVDRKGQSISHRGLLLVIFDDHLLIDERAVKPHAVIIHAAQPDIRVPNTLHHP